jgi:hypothetical protein
MDHLTFLHRYMDFFFFTYSAYSFVSVAKLKVSLNVFLQFKSSFDRKPWRTVAHITPSHTVSVDIPLLTDKFQQLAPRKFWTVPDILLKPLSGSNASHSDKRNGIWGLSRNVKCCRKQLTKLRHPYLKIALFFHHHSIFWSVTLKSLVNFYTL